MSEDIFLRHEGRYYHEQCGPEGATVATATDFDDDEICAECGVVLTEEEPDYDVADVETTEKED